MNSSTPLRFILALVLGLFTASLTFAAASTTTTSTATASTAPFDLAKAKAAYPLDTCVVSGEPLADGDMGPPIDYVYKQKGQPDRLVRFCCEDCISKFKKNPAKYLKIIDAAAKAKAAEKAADPQPKAK